MAWERGGRGYRWTIQSANILWPYELRERDLNGLVAPVLRSVYIMAVPIVPPCQRHDGPWSGELELLTFYAFDWSVSLRIQDERRNLGELQAEF